MINAYIFISWVTTVGAITGVKYSKQSFDDNETPLPIIAATVLWPLFWVYLIVAAAARAWRKYRHD
jgi:hypothetical protein